MYSHKVELTNRNCESTTITAAARKDERAKKRLYIANSRLSG